MGHPLAQKIIEQCRAFTPDSESLVFDYSPSGKISILESLVGKSGFMRVICQTVTALETEDFVLPSGISDDGTPIDAEQCRRFFSLGASQQASPWLAFLDDFQRHWPTDENIYVDFLRDDLHGDGNARSGNPRWRRITEERAGSTQRRK